MKYINYFRQFEKLEINITSKTGDISAKCYGCDNENDMPSSLTSNPIKNKNEYRSEINQILSKLPALRKKIDECFDSTKKWYVNYFSNTEVSSKLKNLGNLNKIKNFINQIEIFLWTDELIEKYSSVTFKEKYAGWVFPGDYKKINIMMLDPGTEKIIVHEMAHSIYFYLKDLGENPVPLNKGDKKNSFDRSDLLGEMKGKENYISSDIEKHARLYEMRKFFDIKPQASCEDIKNLFETCIKNKNIVFRFLFLAGFHKMDNGCYWMKLEPYKEGNPQRMPYLQKEWLEDKTYYIQNKMRLYRVWESLEISTINPPTNTNSQINYSMDHLEDTLQLFFASYTQYKDGYFWTDLSQIQKFNLGVVSKEKKKDDNIDV